MISIIVPAFNAEATLADCLGALLGQTGLAEPYEVIVVDDGSTDGTADLVRRHPAPIRLVAQPHRGAAAARNRGAAAAEGTILLFTDADCRPRPDWAAAMARAFDHPRVAGVKGLFRSDQTALVARLAQAEYAEKEAQMLARAQVAFADTAAAGYRAEVFRAIGGFRTDLRAVEDTELAFRLAAAGHRLVVAPDAVVYHRHPEHLRTYARRKLRYGLWGAQVYLAHPERLADDSRTPWSMRVQLAAAPLALATLAGAPVVPGLAWVAAGLAALFLASAVSLMRRVWGHGWDMVLAAPGLLLVRALAIDVGLAAGLLRRCLDRRPRRRLPDLPASRVGPHPLHRHSRWTGPRREG